MQRDDGFRSKVCPICGKSYVPAPYHAYKAFSTEKAKWLYFCSWTCLCKFREGTRDKKCKSVVMVDCNGEIVKVYDSIKDAANDNGIQPKAIARRIASGRPDSDGFIFKHKE